MLKKYSCSSTSSGLVRNTNNTIYTPKRKSAIATYMYMVFFPSIEQNKNQLYYWFAVLTFSCKNSGPN